MKKIWSVITVIITATFGTIAAFNSSLANEFGEREVDQNRFIAVAIPYGYKKYKLEIIEQIPDRQQCWNESGTSPIAVNLLLLDFDHTDSCRRIKDSNGYSIRIDGKEEKSSLYLIDIIQRNGELQLVAKHENSNLPELLIGRSKGLGEGALKLFLNPGWKVTKRNYQGDTLGHVYLSGDSQTILANNSVNSGGESSTGLPQPSPEVIGTFQIFESDLSGCKPGNYDVSGQFDPSFTQLTITQAPGAEGCFDALPTQVFNTPGLADGGEPVDFTSNAAPGQGQMNGSVRRVYGSFATPITYPGAKDTIGLLAINSQNIVVKDPTGETINENTTILTNIPAPSEKPIAQVLPDLLPAASSADKQIRDTRPGSDTEGMLVVRDKLRVVFDDDATVDEVNTALKAVGSGIIGSYENGTAVTIKIPDTGDLRGIDIVEGILSTQPSVVTTVPVIINEVPPRIDTSGIQSTNLTLTEPNPDCPIVPPPSPPGTPLPTIPQVKQQESIPMYLQVTGAFNSAGNRIEQLGANSPNIFVVDWFSNPDHDDVNLDNPIDNATDRDRPIQAQKNLTIDTVAQIGTKSFACKQWGYKCPKEDKRTPSNPLDSDRDPDVALFDLKNKTDGFKKDNKGKLTIPNSHGFLVSGILAANAGGNCGVVGMYPANNNTRIFAFNAVRDNKWDILLHTLQHLPGQHVINYSGGFKKPNESASLRQGLWWITQIRQRQLTDRVVLVQAAGNESDRNNNRIERAEHLGTWTAAGLVKIEENSTKTKCKGLLGLECTKRVIDRNYGRLKNVLVVESVNAVTGEYANDSNQASNRTLGVRAFGESSDPICPPITLSDGTIVVRFPALSNNNDVVCEGAGGTSSAAPQVAGLAAWVWSRNPGLTASQIVDVIRDEQTTFQRLDNMGNFDTDVMGNPLMSTLTAIDVPQTLNRAAALSASLPLATGDSSSQATTSQEGLITTENTIEGSSSQGGLIIEDGRVEASSCPEGKPEKLGKISVSFSVPESKPSTSTGGIVTGSLGGVATEYDIDDNGIIQPGTQDQQDIKPVLEEFGYDPDEFLAGEYDDPIEVDLNFDGSLETIKILEIPEPCQ